MTRIDRAALSKAVMETAVNFAKCFAICAGVLGLCAGLAFSAVWVVKTAGTEWALAGTAGILVILVFYLECYSKYDKIKDIRKGGADAQ